MQSRNMFSNSVFSLSNGFSCCKIACFCSAYSSGVSALISKSECRSRSGPRHLHLISATLLGVVESDAGQVT